MDPCKETRESFSCIGKQPATFLRNSHEFLYRLSSMSIHTGFVEPITRGSKIGLLGW
jgi:hypothetical protein